jgi:hypothetical protein
MNNNYKLVESCKYALGEKHYSWTLYTALYQYRDNYYYILFDNDDIDNVIISCIVSPATANSLELAICEAINRPQTLETISDVYDNLQNTLQSQQFT